MANPDTAPSRASLSPIAKVWHAFYDQILLRLTAWYALLALGSRVIYEWLPKDEQGMPTGAIRELLTGAAALDNSTGKVSKKEILTSAVSSLGANPTDMVISTLAAMGSAFLLAIPVAWVYMHTRRKKGFAQSLVQTLLILPVIIAGVFIMIKHSLALGFGLGAIVAALKFRTSVDDTKDASFIFLAIAIGLASGVELLVAGTISMLFCYMVIGLWYVDFGRTPARLEGDLAKRRLDRAMAIANRTGAFVARLDDEVLKSLAPEQLEALAARARQRKQKLMGDEETTDEREAAAPKPDTSPKLLRIFTSDPVAARAIVEPFLGEYLADWRFARAASDEDGSHWIEYSGRLAPSMIPQQVLYDVRTRSAPHVIRCELKPGGSQNG